MRVIKLGCEHGPDVAEWQVFLKGRLRRLALVTDGHFGPATHAATVAFQSSAGLTADGVVGPRTLAAAMTRGFDPLEHGQQEKQAGADDASVTRVQSWPPRPVDANPLAWRERTELFGSFSFVAAPKIMNPEAIRITDGWDKKNIVSVTLPLPGDKSLRTSCHRLVSKQLNELFSAWSAAGLLSALETFDGAWNSRFIRGSTSALSNHAFGAAFDINARWNALGTAGALVGELGCVRELVSTALVHGWWWGGWFGVDASGKKLPGGRRDPMHFEAFKLV